MKKLFTICVFALLFSSQGFAQFEAVDLSTQPDVKKEIKYVASELGLNAEQTSALAKIYVKRSKAINPDIATSKTTDKTKVNQKFIESLKSLLTEEQFQKFKAMYKKRE